MVVLEGEVYSRIPEDIIRRVTAVDGNNVFYDEITHISGTGLRADSGYAVGAGVQPTAEFEWNFCRVPKEYWNRAVRLLNDYLTRTLSEGYRDDGRWSAQISIER